MQKLNAFFRTKSAVIVVKEGVKKIGSTLHK
jgi:hypothetical protein